MSPYLLLLSETSKWVQRTHQSKYEVLTSISARTYNNEYDVLTLILNVSKKSPVRAILLHSPGRKPWVNHWNTFIEHQRGGTPMDKVKYSRRKCRSYGAQSAFVCAYPGFHFGLCPHFTLGFAGVSCLKALARQKFSCPKFWCSCPKAILATTLNRVTASK